ncbi:MAG: Hsp20/alpha crystallin family protein [Burkholderiaceae bacterium]|nr:Hsp20/alpha crystallin family protein [Burkholderiaceae bacterium]
MNMILRQRNGYPLRPTLFGNLFDTMLEEFLSPTAEAAREGGAFSPRIDVVENERGYQVEADLPGVTKEHLKVSVDGSRVTIEAEVRREAERKEGETVMHIERVVRKYARSFELPHEVDDAQAVARLEHGVLVLTLPKKQAAQSRLLQIQ